MANSNTQDSVTDPVPPPPVPLLDFPLSSDQFFSLYDQDYEIDPSHPITESAEPQPNDDQVLPAMAQGQSDGPQYHSEPTHSINDTTNMIPCDDHLQSGPDQTATYPDDDTWDFIDEASLDYINVLPATDVNPYTLELSSEVAQSNTLAVPQVELRDQPHVEATTNNDDDDEFPHFSDFAVSDTDVSPEEITQIINGGSQFLESVPRYEDPNPAQSDDQPTQYPTVTQDIEYPTGSQDPEQQCNDPTVLINLVLEEPPAPIEPQLPPPQVAQQPPITRIKNPRPHRHTQRAQCVGQEIVHGNTGKKRERKDTGKPNINVYKCDLCGDVYDELGKMTNHVKHKAGHNIDEVTISWVGDGKTQPARYFISGETYVERVRRQKEELEARRQQAKETKLKRKKPEPEPAPEDEAPNPPPKRRRRAAANTTQAVNAPNPEEPAEPKPKRARATRKRKVDREESPVPEPEPDNKKRRKREHNTPEQDEPNDE